MNKISKCLTTLLAGMVGYSLAFPSASSQATSTEQEVLRKLEQIRSIKVTSDTKLLDQYNKQLDESWKFFVRHKKEVLPVLNKQLGLELRKDKPSDFLLLDIGYFLYLEGDTLYKEEAKRALFSLDHNREIIKRNYQQLFQFTHRVASDGDPRVLEFIDKAFLYKTGISIFVPQHAMTLDGTLMCVFLYGIYGPDSEKHLRTFLVNPNVVKRVIEILIWVGSNNSITQVKKVMIASRDYETFGRALAYMLQTGGPEGRKIMLGLNPKDFDERSQQYYDEGHEAIEAQSYEGLKARFSGFSGDAYLSDNEIKRQLSDMYANYGKDESTNPVAILNSGLPKKYLIGELLKIRSRILYRISDEALSDVKLTNTLINTLHYRAK